MSGGPYLLVLGGNRMAVPAIEVLEASGYPTLVVDRSPEAPARQVASRFIAVDLSDAAATASAVADIELSGVLPLNDFGVRTAATIARDRGLRGMSELSARRVTSKIAMKQAWDAAGLPTAAWVWADRTDILAGRFPAWSRFPCIVKPAFSGGASRGVGLARDWAEVQAIVTAGAAKYLDAEVVIEEYIEGTEHTIETVIAGGEQYLLSISDKENYRGSFTVVQRLDFPGSVGHAHYREIAELVAASGRALGVEYGTTHTEIIIRGGQPYLIEVGGRPGGGINFHPICELSTGYNYPCILAAALTGRPVDMTRAPACHLAWEFFDHPPGLIQDIRGFESLRGEPDVVDIDMYERVGHPSFDLRDDLARPGYVLVRAATRDAARARARDLAARVEFDVAATSDAPPYLTGQINPKCS